MAATESLYLPLTPKVNPQGLAQVDRLIAALEKLEGFEKRTYHINVVADLKGMREGMVALDRMAGQTENLSHSARAASREVKAVADALRQAGNATLAASVQKGIVSTGEAARIARGEVQRLSAEMTRLKAESTSQIIRFEAKYKNPHKLGYQQLSEMTQDRASLDMQKQLLSNQAELLRHAAETQAAVEAALRGGHGESAVDHAAGSAAETAIISNAEVLTEFRKNGFGKLEAEAGHPPIEMAQIEKLQVVLDKRLAELNAAITSGTRLMAEEKATLTRSELRYKQDRKTGEMVPVRQVSEAVTGPGERLTLTRTNAEAGAIVDLKVNEEVRRMAQAMQGLTPELKRAAATLADTVSIGRARSRGVTEDHVSALVKAGALGPTGRTTKEFREAAGFALSGISPFSGGAAASPVAMRQAAAAAGGMAQAEGQLARQSQASAAALASQDAILLEKLKHLRQAEGAAGAFGGAEKDLARQSQETAAAMGSSYEAENKLIQQRYRNGRLVQKTFVDEGGITRKVNFTEGGKEVTTEEFNRLKEASQRVRDLRDEYTQMLATHKAEGASAREISEIYAKYGKELDRAATDYKDLEKAGVTTIGRLAQAQKKQGQRVLAIDARQQAAAAAKEAERLAKEQDRQARERETKNARIREQALKRVQQEQRVANQRLAAQGLLNTLDLGGYSEKSRSTRTTAKGRTVETVDYGRENALMRESIKLVVERDRAGRLLNASVAETSRVMKEAGKQAGYSAKDFIHNTLTVAAWALSVGALYGSLNLLRRGAEGMGQIEAQTALLMQVFRGGRTDALALRDGVLALGYAYNRTSEEAMDAAIRFSRLGLSRIEVTEAVAVSLQAANVAEISAAQAAEQLSAIYAAYNLNVGQLRGTLAQLNTISNTYNATNKEMLAGIARVAPLAKQAGLSLNELTALVGAGIGRTGRPGSEFGNAIKAVIAQINNPRTQSGLKNAFGIDVTDQTGELKNFSDILRELFVRYQELNGADRQQLALMIGKKMQASRLTALLDGYVQAQLLAIRANRDMTSAEEENAKIRATLRSQLQGLTTAYESLFSALGQSNVSSGVNSFLTNLVELLKNFTSLLARNGDASATLATGLAALGAVTVVNIARTGQMGEASGFLTNSLVSCRIAAATLWKEFVAVNLATTRAIPGLRGLAGAIGLVGAAATVVEVLTGMVVIMAAVAAATAVANAAMGGINAVFEHFSDEAEKANARLAGFNEELERLSKASDAEKRVANLAGSLAQILQSPTGNRKDMDEWLKMLEEASGLQSGELTSLYQMGDIVKLLARLEETRVGALRRGARFQEEGLIASRQTLADAKERLRLAGEELRARGRNPLDDDAYRTLNNRVMEMQGEAIAKRPETEGEADGVEQTNEALDHELKLLEHKLKLIDKIYDSLSRSTEAERNADEIAAQEAKLALLDQESAARDKNAAAIQAEIDANDRSFQRREDYQRLQQQLQSIQDRGDAAAFRTNQFERGIQRDLGSGGLWGKIKAGATLTGRYLTGDYGRNQNDWKTYLDTYLEEHRLLSKNRDLVQEGARWAARNNALQSEQAKLTEKTNTERGKAIEQQKEEIRAELEKLKLEQEFQVKRLDAIAAGKRDEAAQRGQDRIGENSTEQDLAEMRAGLGSEGRINKSTGLSDAVAALEEYRRIQARIKEARASGGSIDEKDELRSLQLLEQLRASGVRLEELRLNQVTRIHSIEADITNEKIRQQKEASQSLIMASREDQLRAAMAARMARDRGRGFSAEEFQYIDTSAKQSLRQTNPDLMPPELQGRTRELELEKQKLEDFFQGVEGLNGAIKAKAEELRSLKIEPPVLGVPGGGQARQDGDEIEAAGELMVKAVQSLSSRFVSAVDIAGGQMIDAITRMGAGFDARIARLERGSVASAIGRAQSGAVSAMT